MAPAALGPVYNKVARYLPDLYRSPEAFYSLYAMKGSMFFEVGAFQGAFWLTEVIIGWKANIHIVLWDKAYLGKKWIPVTRQIMYELLDLFQLQRLEAFIPTTLISAGRYAERIGFKLEGILRKAAVRDGQLTNVAAYSLIKGED